MGPGLGCSYADDVTLLLPHHCYPKGRPNPQDPKGGTGATPRHPALRRGEGDRRPTRRAAPYRQKSDPAPPEIGRGSKRAFTHRAGKSNRLM